MNCLSAWNCLEKHQNAAGLYGNGCVHIPMCTHPLPIVSKPKIDSNSLMNQSKAAVTANSTPAAYALFIQQKHPTRPLSIKRAYAHTLKGTPVWLSIPYISKMQLTNRHTKTHELAT